MAVGLREPLDRRARHQERLEDTVLDQGHVGGRDAFVVVVVVAAKIDVAESGHCRVVAHGEKRGQDRLADLLGEGLTLLDVLLAVALDAVAEDLVEEDAAGPVAQDGRAGVGLDQRGLAQGQYLIDDLLEGLDDLLVVGQPGLGGGVEDVRLGEFHAILGFG